MVDRRPIGSPPIRPQVDGVPAYPAAPALPFPQFGQDGSPIACPAMPLAIRQGADTSTVPGLPHRTSLGLDSAGSGMRVRLVPVDGRRAPRAVRA